MRIHHGRSPAEKPPQDHGFLQGRKTQVPRRHRRGGPRPRRRFARNGHQFRPSHGSGNIVNINDPKERVIGYIGVHNIEEKRIFITRTELQDSLLFSAPQKVYCYEPVITAQLSEDSIGWVRTLTTYYESGYVLPINPSDSLPQVLQLTNIPFANKSCVDCRLYGTNIKPDFWLNDEVYDGAIGCR